VALWAVIGYAAGSFPSTWVMALATGKRAVLDRVRRNAGEADAHVLLQEAGGQAAHIAAVLDVVKAFGPVLAATRFAGPYAVGACAVGAVAGHCWPPLFGRYAGRGLAAGAGAFLGFLPVEMAVAGVLRVLGTLVHAAVRGQPAPYVGASAAINVLIFARRLEGVKDDVDQGASVSRAMFRRVVLDASGT
jgi:glycerol-3-phosphate acyltransferase PlsY